MLLMHRLRLFVLPVLIACAGKANAQQITAGGQPAQLDIRIAGAHSLRITLKPVSFENNFPYTPAVVERNYPAPVISLREISKPIKKKAGNFNVEVRPAPLSVIITNNKNEKIQDLVFRDDGMVSFRLDDQPVLGMGEGGPKPERGLPWRQQPIQFDRRGKMDSMQPR